MILKVIVQEARALRLEAVRLSIWHLMCDYFAIIVEGSKPDLTIIIAQDDQPIGAKFIGAPVLSGCRLA